MKDMMIPEPVLPVFTAGDIRRPLPGPGTGKGNMIFDIKLAVD